MDTWTPLWSKIVDSSIWSEADDVRIVFVTMLALKDADHVVRYSAFQLGQRAKKSEGEVLKALKILAAPDKKRLEPQPHEGRRIKKVADGWLMLNGEEYRKKVSEEMRKSRLRRAQAAFRQRKKSGGSDCSEKLARIVVNGDAAADAAAQDQRSQELSHLDIEEQNPV